MKPIAGALLALFLMSGTAAQAAAGDPSACDVSVNAAATAAAASEHPAKVVPAGQTYVIYRNGAAAGRFTSGATWGGAGGLNATTGNCVKIPCPGKFKPGIVCWDCHSN